MKLNLPTKNILPEKNNNSFGFTPYHNELLCRLLSDKLFSALFHQNFKLKDFGSGFTIVEILVVISITAIIGGVGFASFANYSRSQHVEQAALDLKQMLEQSRAKATARVKPHFIDTSLVPPVRYYETCFIPARNGIPDQGSDSTPQDLVGYRVEIDSALSQYTLYVICSNEPASDGVLIFEQKTLPSDITFASPPCSGLFNYESETNLFRCDTTIPASGATYTITLDGFGGAVTKEVVLDQYGNAKIQ